MAAAGLLSAKAAAELDMPSPEDGGDDEEPLDEVEFHRDFLEGEN